MRVFIFLEKSSCLLTFFLLIEGIYGQTVIKGLVTSDGKDPLPGVSLLVVNRA